MARDTALEARITLTVNGRHETITVEHHHTLLQALRQKLFLTGAKEGCGVGECGACTVIMNGRAVNSCLVLAVEADSATIDTVEGEARTQAPAGAPAASPDKDLSDLQVAFVKHGAIQCGFCTPGMLMSSRELLRRNPHPTREEIKEAIAGNLCRCTGYVPIVDAIAEVAGLPVASMETPREERKP